MLVDEKLALGHELIRAITRVDATELAAALRAEGYGVTTVKASGMNGEVGVIYIVVNRKNQKRALELIRQSHPQAFITTQNIHYVDRPPEQGQGAEKARPEFLVR